MVVTSSSPELTARLNRSPRSLCSRAEKAEPEWVMNVIPPAPRPSGSENPHARRPRSSLTKPIPLPPQSGIPAPAAMAASRWPSVGWPGRGGS